MRLASYYPAAFALLLMACHSEPDTLFTALDASDTGVTFANTLTETPEQNVMTYEYTYNGGGVAAGDLNNDGLTDLFFTGNQVENKLYINRYDSTTRQLRFDDVTAKAGAGIAGRRGHWKTGVTMADVNGDGWLDIYVCYSALPDTAARANQLFINNQCRPGDVPTFTERGNEYGLAAPGTFSTQASFFDCDRDGDLDMFLVNHANTFYNPLFNTHRLRNLRHPYFGNRLYRNEGGPRPRFTDVSVEAGIHGGGINFGLAVAVSDLTGDGWPDLYVANDYEEQDYFYENDQHGHFRERTKDAFAHLSRNTMGVDIADVNNDARPDVVTLDMLPQSWERQKLLKGPDEYDRFQMMVDSGYGHQHMRNMLHLGGGKAFTEVGQLAGMSNTDWSWAALLADFDLDGRKDLYITNGVVRDFTGLDFLKYDVEAAKQAAQAQGKALTTDDDFKRNLPAADLIAKLPSTKVDNVAYRNRDGLHFDDVTGCWGLAEGQVSTGAAYADLDNDGDLDLVVNNTNAPAALYRNNADTQLKHDYLTVRLQGEGANRFGVGALVTVTRETLRQTQELIPTRGFQSAVEPRLTFGLGAAAAAPVRVQVRWPDGRVSVIDNVKPNRQLTVGQRGARAAGNVPGPGMDVPNAETAPLFGPPSEEQIPFVHRENPYVDFKQEPLIPYQLSRQGPALAAADVNGDGRVDVFVGGATGQASGLFLQGTNGSFAPASLLPAMPASTPTPADAVAALFFDADGDRDPDLYVVRGGNEYAPNAPNYQDQLFLNVDGKFSLGTLPAETAPGSCVATADYDRDGDLDLFVGGRAVPGQFSVPAPSYLLRNEGKAPNGTPRFSVQKTWMPGMVTGATWADVDRDGWPDLLLVGDWMPVTYLRNQRGALADVAPEQAGLAQTGGLWTGIVPHDLDGDGDPDFLLGNLGTNVQWKARGDTTLTLLAADFNADGRVDPVICQRVGGQHIPLASRDELLDQIGTLRARYVRYADYAKATAETMFDAEQLRRAKTLTVHTLASSVLENLGKGRFRLRPLPAEAQVSTVQGFVVQDFTGDGQADILLAGNYYPLRVQQGRCDAGRGLLLTRNKGRFTLLQTDVSLTGDIRRLLSVPTSSGTLLVAARNNGVVVTARKR